MSNKVVGHQYIWVGKTEILKFASVGQNVQCFTLYAEQFNKWIGQMTDRYFKACPSQNSRLATLLKVCAIPSYRIDIPYVNAFTYPCW